MKIILNLLINALAVYITSQILPGIILKDFGTAIIVSVVLGVVNTIIKPILLFLTLPITIVTLGLFTLVLNGLMVLLVGYLVPGFVVTGFWWAIIFSLVLTLVSGFLNNLKSESGN